MEEKRKSGKKQRRKRRHEDDELATEVFNFVVLRTSLLVVCVHVSKFVLLSVSCTCQR